MNKFESALAAIAPIYAVKRARARMALDVARAYEAAGKGRRNENWKTAGTSANAEVRHSIATLRNRARALVRDNPYATRAVSAIASNIVGYGIKTTPQTANKKASKPLAKAWADWAESTQCDSDGINNMYALQELAARCIVESGEVLIRRVWRNRSEGLAVPMQIQVLEPDYIDTGREGAYNSNTIIQGVEYDTKGRRVAYWLFEGHPGETVNFRSPASKRVASSDIIHIHRMDRAGQVRGITWFAPVIIRLRDFDEYEDAQLVRQKIAACFTAFVRDTESAENTGAAKTDDLIDRMEPALIQRLGPGQDVTLASPPGVQGYGEYSSVTLHGISTGLCVPYELLTTDYSQVNFTSGRMGKSDFHTLVDTWQWNMFIPKFCGNVFGWFAEAAVLAGLPAQGATAKFTPPRRTLTDPTREIPAMIKAVRGGAMTLFEMIRQTGYEPEEFLAEIKAGNDMLDTLGITLDCDPRKVTNAGQAQSDGTGSFGDDAENDNAKGKDKSAA